MANQEHLEVLFQGAEKWNRWRVDNPELKPDLSGANLNGRDLTIYRVLKCGTEPQPSEPGINFKDVDLSNADLTEVKLIQGMLTGSNLTEAKLTNARLNGCDFSGACLDRLRDAENASLTWASFDNAKLIKANLAKTDLWKATFKEAVCDNTNFSGANLKSADFIRTNLYQAKFKEAEIRWTNFSNANLNRISGAIFDETVITGARLGVRAPDPWSVLRREYSGVMMAFTLVFLLLFFLPYAGRTVVWVGVNKIQEASQNFTNSFYHETSNQKIESIGLCGHTDCRQVLIFDLVSGKDKGVPYFFLVLSLFLYNASRGYLTRRVGQMRDEEDRSGITPEYSDAIPYLLPLDEYSGVIPLIKEKFGHVKQWFHGYKHLFFLHKYCVRPLGYISILSILWNAWYWFNQPVWIPV